MEDYRLDWTQANQENDQFAEAALMVDPMMLQAMMQPQQGPVGPPALGAGQPATPGGPMGAPMMPQLVPPPMPWENHTIHLHIHRQFIMSDVFKEIPPVLQQMMLMHMQLHYMMASAMQPKGQPGQGGNTKDEGGENPQKAGQGANPAVQGEPESE